MRVIVKEAGRARCPRPLDTAGEEPAEGHGPALSPGHSLERGGSCGHAEISARDRGKWAVREPVFPTRPSARGNDGAHSLLLKSGCFQLQTK